MEKLTKDCAIIVSTCDAYSDVWDSFFIQFFKYWPDCPYSVYITTNKKIYKDKRVKTITTGEDKGWATNMRLVFERINIPYFIILLEDFPLKKKVDTERIKKLLEIIKKENAAYLRLYPAPGPDKKFKNYKEVGEVSKEAPYRTSLMAAIWNTEIFKSLLKDEETAWDMEFAGAERSKKIEEPFLSVILSPILKRNNNPAIDYFCSTIKKGRWFYDGVKFYEKEGIQVDTTKRKIETYNHYLLRKIVHLPYLGRVIGFGLRRMQLIK